ncbi:hypothetical protein HHI36_015046 [Cryptolaemus montrouzieri]|uniref:TGF-beta propeptide domain-containing protein n=1 Tax=Cryptolaemus montrouzieri TaxID=559131 RepID=A0ABD2N4W8_9CUCU
MYLVEDVSESHLLVFELPTTGKDEIFSYAELKILTLVKRAKESTNGIRKQISVSVYDETQRKFNKVHMLHIHHTKNTWLSFNLTNQVAKILNNRGSSKNLQVAVTTSSIISLYSEETYNLKLSLLPSNEHNFEHDYPILLLSYVSNSSQDYGENVKEDKKRKNIRRRRFIDEDYYEEETNNIWDDLVSKKIHEKKLKRSKNACKRKPLHINFAEINYDEWIVQPSGYEVCVFYVNFNSK